MDFTFVSDDLALDFAATLTWRTSYPIELLAEPADLAAWATQSGLTERPGRVSRAALDRARLLREAIYRTAAAAERGDEADAADVRLIRDEARGSQVTVALIALGESERRGDIGAVLATVATRAGELFGGPNRRLVRHCAGESCTRFFLDRSRTGSRRWCDKSSCGSRANASAYRRRKSTALPPGGKQDR
ncbi:ABATE domain-containing protein [Streptomyces sp. ASQP_92]|uniref:CGNR zinc finger domain-containing protein n=1 Tax=Streptomyces sp. ASQP_92 TaxID=2979116 RepID=UPI0021C11DCA|nr:ABATE domain-containing protein [Streptomyces sp. ASQP_92]MCT9089712.1 ABATE domain-containing protein [Streptomyces sp. ASQP_92]